MKKYMRMLIQHEATMTVTITPMCGVFAEMIWPNAESLADQHRIFHYMNGVWVYAEDHTEVLKGSAFGDVLYNWSKHNGI